MAKSKWELFLSNFWIIYVQIVWMNAEPNNSRKCLDVGDVLGKKNQNLSYALQVLLWCDMVCHPGMALELFSFRFNTTNRLLPSPVLPESSLTSIFSILVLALFLL